MTRLPYIYDVRNRCRMGPFVLIFGYLAKTLVSPGRLKTRRNAGQKFQSLSWKE